jgi:DNA-binding transcriptional LysR family regulator
MAGFLFELRQLRCFVAAADELHFGRAARRLNMTQPPLSRQIQLLEHALGVRLFERSSRNVALTSAGRVFLLEARRILRLSESAALATRRVASGEAGTITIGFTAASGYSYLPRLITLCRERLPNITIHLKEMVSADQIEALLSRRVDVGLLRPPIDRVEFATMRTLVEPLVAALPSGDPRVAKAKLTVKDFDQQPFIMYAPEGAKYFHDMLVGLFDAAEVAPITVQHLSQVHSMLGLVRAGIGAAVVPEAATSLHLDDVVFRPLATNPANPVELYTVWRADSDNPALEPLVNMLQESLGGHSGLADQ